MGSPARSASPSSAASCPTRPGSTSSTTRRASCSTSARLARSASGWAPTSAAVSLDEDYPRVYFTREKHRSNRAYFGPFSSAKRVRETLDLLGKLFQFRTCEGKEPGRRSGSPCLDYYIKRCGAPCVGYIDRDEYRRNIDQIVGFLSGRYKAIAGDLED